jgi:hypothetical protein
MQVTTEIKKINLDIDEVIIDMMDVIKSAASNEWYRIWPVALHALKLRKSKFKYLSALRVNNEISNDYLLNAVEEERLVIMAEIEAEVMISKDILNEALLAAMRTLVKSIEKIL